MKWTSTKESSGVEPIVVLESEMCVFPKLSVFPLVTEIVLRISDSVAEPPLLTSIIILLLELRNEVGVPFTKIWIVSVPSLEVKLDPFHVAS